MPPPAGGGASGGGGARQQLPAPKPGEFDYDKAIQPDRERPASQPGAILRVTLDTNHWLTAGNDGETQVMIEGNRVFAPIKLNSGRNVGVYATKDKLIASGLIWPEAQDILVQKAFLMHQPFGQGHVIAFAEEPNYRAFTEGDDAAVHERGVAGAGLLRRGHGVTETRRQFFEIMRSESMTTGI